jgi:hypothetical protein
MRRQEEKRIFVCAKQCTSTLYTDPQCALWGGEERHEQKRCTLKQCTNKIRIGTGKMDKVVPTYKATTNKTHTF